MTRDNNNEIPADFRLDSYVFELPRDRIAPRPTELRDASRLLVLDRESGACDTERSFADLPEILAAKFPQGGLIVANDSRVFPARIFGQRQTGGKAELLLLTPLPLLEVKTGPDGACEARAEGLLRTAKRMKEGERAQFAGGLEVTLRKRGEYGRCEVGLRWSGDLLKLFSDYGHMPLPPYLERPDDQADRERYQTLHARADKSGSVAAPTAGLHMTPQVREALRAKGFGWAQVTLYVGYGTFSPVRTKDIRAHAMHAEYVEVPEETAAKIRAARSAGRPVLALGTTSARALEGMHKACAEVRAWQGETRIFITPGYEFAVVEGLITNFHLPESSLLIMVSALAGRAQIMHAYAAAIASGYRFFSYGDAMLIA